ncbi:hypothetical protein ACFOLC_07525 [Lysobacter cavernae]|uniref:DUF3011 domain-containing protein n=1 Tax=Lysobacter cavernae TaxID=1685901 RepID=A0ABV7RQF3_9GAMM
MRRTKIVLIAIALTLLSGIALAQSGGGCLAGYYEYRSDDGQVIGASSVGCAENWSWGLRSDNYVFHAGCSVAS